MSEEVIKLKEELEIATKKYWERWGEAPPGMGFGEYENWIRGVGDEMERLSRQVRLIEEPTFSEIPDYGDVMSLKEFIDCVESGGFIDYDGSGNYVRDGKMSNISIYPSDVENSSVRKDFDTIIWFNR